MSTSVQQSGYSSDVRMQLNVNGFVLKIDQLGPQFIILRDPVDHPSVNAEIVMSIDGRVRRWNVHLPDGISPDRPRTKTAAPLAS